METKEIKITPPEGYEIDRENSTFECIKFKKKQLTYEDIAKMLFRDKELYYITSNGSITSGFCNDYFRDLNIAVSKKQLEKLLAINKLMNVAKFLNGSWKPDWNNKSEYKYFITEFDNHIIIDQTDSYNSRIVYFKSKELALQAIDILGEDTIRLALSTDW